MVLSSHAVTLSVSFLLCVCCNVCVYAAHCGTGFPFASHFTGKLSSKAKAIRDAGENSVIVGSCSTGKEKNRASTQKSVRKELQHAG